MFRSSRWRNEKNRIKAAFKLQFHATQVSKANADSLVISVVPGDAGKPTSRSEKVAVREGSCQWEYPVYETVNFIQDVKTGKINERPYHFIISTGFPKNRLVGEVSVDFADYADLTKVSTVSLPLKNTKTGGVLHVSIQRLQENGDRRGEDSEDTNIKSQNRTLNTQLRNDDNKASMKSNYTEDGSLPNATIRCAGVNDNSGTGTSSGSDITMSGSESSSGLNTPRELELRNDDLLHDSTGFLSSQTHISAAHLMEANAAGTTYEEHQQYSDHGRSSGGSLDGSQIAIMTERSRQTSDIEIGKLKDELVALARKENVTDLELQTLRKQIVKESKKGQEQSREIAYLKEERDMFKSECEKLKASRKRVDEARSKNKLQFEGGDPWAIIEEIRQELTYEKDLNSNLRVQLQKMQESNAELILAVKDLDEMLEQKAEEISDLSNKLKSCNNVTSGTKPDDEEEKTMEAVVNKHRAVEEKCIMEQEIMNLSGEVEILRRERDEMELQMEQLALDYELLKQENHEMSHKLQQMKMQYECSLSVASTDELEGRLENLHNEIKKLSKEKSDSSATIIELEDHVKNLEEQLEKQTQGFEADLEAVSRARVEQEQRAIIAEEALRNARRKNANTAEKLQEEFRKLSMQMASTFDANEKIAMNALAEASELCIQKEQLEKMLQKAMEELQSVKDDYEEKLCELSDQLDTSRQLEQQKQEELREDYSQDIFRLNSELDRCRLDYDFLSEQVKQKENVRLELEQMKESLKHAEILVQKAKIDKEELETTIGLAKKEAEKSLEELNRMKCLKDEKEAAISHFEFEVETLKSQCNGLKNSLLESQLEKEKLKKQVIQFKSDLKKVEALVDAEKKPKERTKRGAVSEGAKNTPRNKSVPVPHGSKEVSGLKEKIKLLEGQIKLKETSLEASTNSFLEKERDLRNVIEALESRFEEANQNGASLCEDPQENTRSTKGSLDAIICSCKENGNPALVGKRHDHPTISEEETKTSASNDKDYGTAEALSSELKWLKERNKEMEDELREMEDRYSEISLKFAEVEGERQQLVMTVRNLKKTKKR